MIDKYVNPVTRKYYKVNLYLEINKMNYDFKARPFWLVLNVPVSVPHSSWLVLNVPVSVPHSSEI